MSGDAYARRSDPDTSGDAANRTNATRLESVVIKTLKLHGPMTSREVADATGVERVAISPRFAPLQRKGYIVATGERRGRSVVWALVEGQLALL